MNKKISEAILNTSYFTSAPKISVPAPLPLSLAPNNVYSPALLFIPQKEVRMI